MMDWDKLRIFHAVATAQSFTRAGQKLNLSQSAISRHISSLEESLQVSLFHRHARGLLLTEQGEILFQTVADVFTRLAAAENALHDSRERPRGPLVITAPTAIGTMWLTPHMREFCELYPEIAVTMLADDHELDLVKREADVAIRLFPARHAELVQKKLTVLNNSLYASAEYLRLHGTPRKVADLSRHRLIAYAANNNRAPFNEVNWAVKLAETKSDENTKPFFRINSMRGIVRAVESGMGIAGLPDYMSQGTKLVKIMPDVKGPVTEVYFIYSMEVRNSKRVNAFKEFLVRKLAEDGMARNA